jgi:hypothetical protein
MTFHQERLATCAVGFLIAYAGLASVFRAARRLFSCDEVVTVALARLPTLAATHDALKHAADSHPPLFHTFERLASHLPVSELIAFRVPSVLAFCTVLVCLFLFIKQRRGSSCALVCTAILMMSVLYSSYAVEARGYSLMAGFVALALLSYQRAEDNLWCLIMGLSLAAAEGVHYYASFAILVFGLAELAVVTRFRRVRWGVWLAFLFGTLPLAIFWPLLQGYKTYYAIPYMNYLSVDQTLRSYGWMFDLPPNFGVGIAVAAVAAVLIYGFFRPVGGSGPEIPIQEHILTLGFLLLPFMMYLALRLTHGGFNPRYVILSTLGFPLAASYVVSLLDRRQLTLFLVFVLAILGAQEGVFWRFQLYLVKHPPSETAAIERMLATAGHSDLPLVDSDPLDYIPLAYYASPELYRRTFFLVDPAAALTYVGSDTADKSILTLPPYMRLQVAPFEVFAATHPQFLVYSDGRGIWDWWPTRLLHDGYRLETVAMSQGTRIYLARKAQ